MIHTLVYTQFSFELEYQTPKMRIHHPVFRKLFSDEKYSSQYWMMCLIHDTFYKIESIVERFIYFVKLDFLILYHDSKCV